MTTDGHPVDHRNVPPELEPDYEATRYVDPWNSVMQRLKDADPELLKRLANWGIGDTGV